MDRIASLNLDAIVAAGENPLTRSFGSFHTTLKSSLEIARMYHPVTAVSFSDSAFIVTGRLHEAARLAIDLVTTLLWQRIPVRVGIAYGSFAALRFRSDVMVDTAEHAVHFLGTGVVRAHAAETCGVKGIRILVDPSAAPLLSDVDQNPPPPAKGHISLVELPEHERGSCARVEHGIDYWSLRPSARGRAWHALQDMWNAAPASEQIHYQATAEAINRMRMRQGHQPLDKLRRRTLPQTG